MRAGLWWFTAGALVGVLPLGLLDDPLTPLRVVLAAIAGIAVAGVVARLFNDGSDLRRRFVGALGGAWSVLALGVALAVTNA